MQMDTEMTEVGKAYSSESVPLTLQNDTEANKRNAQSIRPAENKDNDTESSIRIYNLRIIQFLFFSILLPISFFSGLAILFVRNIETKSLSTDQSVPFYKFFIQAAAGLLSMVFGNLFLYFMSSKRYMPSPRMVIINLCCCIFIGFSFFGGLLGVFWIKSHELFVTALSFTLLGIRMSFLVVFYILLCIVQKAPRRITKTLPLSLPKHMYSKKYSQKTTVFSVFVYLLILSTLLISLFIETEILDGCKYIVKKIGIKLPNIS